MTEKLGVNEKEPAFGQKTPTTTTADNNIVITIIFVSLYIHSIVSNRRMTAIVNDRYYAACS